MIGYYGKIIFVTNDKRVLTFNNYKRTLTAKWSEHNIYKKKARSEFLGTELEKITFTIPLNANLGVNPRKEMIRWRKLLNKGFHDYLIMGKLKVGNNQWKLESITEIYDVILSKGEIFSAQIDITMSEYVATK